MVHVVGCRHQVAERATASRNAPKVYALERGGVLRGGKLARSARGKHKRKTPPPVFFVYVLLLITNYMM